jgi:hypothetical protein
MGRGIAFVQEVRRVDSEGVPIVEITLDDGSGDAFTAQLYQPPGVDSLPLVGDEATSTHDGDDAIVQGLTDTKLEGVSKEGEFRIFSRSGQGVVAAEIYLQKDGTIRVKTDGDVILDAATVTITGDLKVNGEVTAKAQTTPVNLSSHLHPTPLGPTSPPTPGT